MTTTKRCVIRVVVGFASGVAILVGLVALSRNYTSRQQDELRREGKRILARIQAYHELHYRFPASFEEAGIKPDPRIIRFSDYSLSTDNEFHFVISNRSDHVLFYFSRYDRFDLVEPSS